MASISMFLAPATASTTTGITATRARRVRTFATKKGSGGSSEEKGFFEWLMGAMDKDGLVETDPLLQKVEGKSSGTRTTISGKKTMSGKKTTSGKKTAVVPPKKSGGFAGLGGFFSKE
ncbi:hypothetical protein SSX86_020273 [Deinandra increscens subsp. villosa]|uniref:Uncharacterized protein n=1 Tax=Deinandra increscens subsp. villosa TaxID=3103831 RepID=A0AAP0CMP4_9ASTR